MMYKNIVLFGGVFGGETYQSHRQLQAATQKRKLKNGLIATLEANSR